jgi:hypothetical protein
VTMPLMQEKLYDALRAGDVPDDKARAAAIEAAEFDSRLNRIDSTLRVHSWMLTFNTALLVAIAGKLFLGH